MKIDVHAIEVVEAIVEQGSFAKAAEKLHKVRSALTYTINQLEDSLGVSLFDRSGHRAVLTSAGKEFLKQGQTILAQCQQLEDHITAFKGGWEENLYVSYNDLIPFSLLTPMLQAFEMACPYTRISLSAERLNGTIESVVNGNASLCIGASRDVPNESGYDSFSLGSIEFVFAVDPNHPLANVNEPLLDKDIRKYTAIVASDTALTLQKRSVGVNAAQKTITVSSLEAKKALQLAGIGVGFLPKAWIENEINAGLLVPKSVATIKPDLPMTVLWKSEPIGQALAWLITYLRNEFRISL